MHACLCREAVCTIFMMVFGMTRPRGELTTYRVSGGHATIWANPTRLEFRISLLFIISKRKVCNVFYIYETSPIIWLCFTFPQFKAKHISLKHYNGLIIIKDCFFHRHVILPPDIAKLVPKTHLMTETEWRNLGVQQSPGWVHYMVHAPGV